jgi:hypothetical protein
MQPRERVYFALDHREHREPDSWVIQNVPDFGWVTGNPAVQVGWMCAGNSPLKLPLHGHAETTCVCERTCRLAAGLVTLEGQPD